MSAIPKHLIEKWSAATVRLDRARTRWDRADAHSQEGTRCYIAYVEALKLWLETDAEILKHENKALRRALRKAAPGHPLCEVV